VGEFDGDQAYAEERRAGRSADGNSGIPSSSVTSVTPLKRMEAATGRSKARCPISVICRWAFIAASTRSCYRPPAHCGPPPTERW